MLRTGGDEATKSESVLGSNADYPRFKVRRTRIETRLGTSSCMSRCRHWGTRAPVALPIANWNVSDDKPFADELNKERGIVSCRVALLLRSSEIKPLL